MNSKRIKFTIHGFQQSRLIEYGLNNDDALLMSVVKDMYSSTAVESKIIDGDRYIWVSQTYMTEYVPILGVYRTVRRAFKKLSEKGILDVKTVNSRNGKSGKYFYVKPTSKMDDLTEYVNINEVMGQDVLRSKDKVSHDQGTKCPIKDSSTNDSSTNDSKDSATSVASISNEQIEEIANIWNSIIGTPNIRTIKKQSSRFKALNARFKEYDYDTIVGVLCKVRDSRFLTGSNNRAWSADFDWVMKPKNFLKILEDNYINKEINNEINQNNHGQSNLSRFQRTAINISSF